MLVPKCIYPKSIFSKCTRLACLLSFASLFCVEKSERGAGGSRPIQNFLIRKNLGIQIDGGGGLARLEKLILMPPLYWQ